MHDVLVVNASPLIFLGNAGRVDLLNQIGATKIMVPQSVFDEVTTASHEDRASRAVAEAEWLVRVAPSPPPSAIVEWDLGAGESDVIAACIQIGRATPVIDDLAGRKCALSLGLPPIGTLGVVIRAYRRGSISDPRKLLLDLRSAGMWLSDAVVEHALRLAGVSPRS
jgi:predicted nucleic acid-binding protein